MRVLAGLCAFAALAALLPAPAEEPTKSELLLAVERQLKAVAETAGPGIACVVVSRSELYPKPAKPPAQPGQLGAFDAKAFLQAHPGREELARFLDLSDLQSVPDHGYAGGIVIDPAGLVLVNYHSIDGATKVYVHLPGGKGSYADIHAADGRSDLAVLRLLDPPEGLKAVKLGEARTNDTPGKPKTVQVGKLVVLMVNPYVTGFAVRPSSALGSVTNVRRRPSERQDGRYRSVYIYGLLIEHDARLNAGCSGGALLNLDGEVIGLTTTVAAVAGGELGPGFALPFDPNTRRVIEVLRRGEEVEYGFAGVTLYTNRPGIVLQSVTPRSPAAAAGLRPEDTVVRIDDNPARDYDDLLLYLGSALAGTKVRLGVLGRDRDRTREVELTLAKFRNESPSIASVRPEPVFGLRVDYGSILAQALQGNVQVESRGIEPGVCVRELVPDSPAAAKFKALGDNPRWLITHVNGTPTPTPAEFYKATRGQQSVKLSVTDPADPTLRRETVTLP